MRSGSGISNRQKALLHVAKTQLGLDDDVYRLILEQEAGVTSSKDLTPHGFEKVLARFEQIGFEPELRYQRGRATQRDPQALTTPAQQKLINDLYDILGWDERKRRTGFNRRVVKKPWPQTREEANKVIEALKAMVARQENQA